jgi:ABC-type sugar transport system ATPase subunit
MNLADRIIVMSHGKIEAIGKPNSLAEKSKTYRELQLISSSGKEEHAEN